MSSIHPGYSLASYGEMLMCSERTAPYLEAMRQAIKPGDIVLDIGAGPGLISMLAARMGAGKVIAVEPNPSIRLARRLIEDNGLSDRVICIEGLSTELELENRADVIVSDLRGVLPLFSEGLPSIIDARERLLAPKGRLIPQRDILMAAPVTHASGYRRITHPWRENEYGLQLDAGADFESNHWTKVTLTGNQLLADAQTWFTLDYNKLMDRNAQGEASWQIQHDGELHGIAMWFDSELAPGVGFSNHPSQPPLFHGQGFMPMRRPISVKAGDRVLCSIRAHWLSVEYIWEWKGTIEKKSGEVVERFEQSTYARRLMMRRAKS